MTILFPELKCRCTTALFNAWLPQEGIVLLTEQSASMRLAKRLGDLLERVIEGAKLN